MPDYTYMSIEQVKDDDPNRCQAVTGQGQCTVKATDGSTFCECHGGNRAVEEKNRKNKSAYRLTKYQARLDIKRNFSGLKSLSDEIGILRIIMEETIERCDTNVTLALAAPQIADLAVKIEKLVTSCDKLDRKMGQYLDKSAIIQLGIEIVAIISDEVADPEVVDAIADRMADAFERSANQPVD